ncbi:MAG: sulfate ABC transporter ATP-binding protein [Candidatus Korobacteraceae bacterium]
MSIEVRNIRKLFGNFVAVDDVNLHVASGELVALLGPSGSGKTTLLRMIAGLEFPDSGSILLNEEDATNHGPARRRVGFVFQHYALFRHMSIFENVAFGMRVQPRKSRLSKNEIRDRVLHLLELVQLERLASHYPNQLSGGQRQRVALARALAVEPKLLLLDEPFGALDAKVRKELRRWLRRLHDELHIASVFVTHDQEEALEVADRVAVMNQGRLEQVGTPQEVYDNPASAFVYNFLGNVNLFHGRIDSGHAHIGELEVALPENASGGDGPALGYARPYEMIVMREPGAASAIRANLRHIFGVGPNVKLELQRCDTGTLLEAELGRKQFNELDLKLGDVVYVTPRNLRVFAEDYSI